MGDNLKRDTYDGAKCQPQSRIISLCQTAMRLEYDARRVRLSVDESVRTLQKLVIIKPMIKTQIGQWAFSVHIEALLILPLLGSGSDRGRCPVELRGGIPCVRLSVCTYVPPS